MEQIPFVSDIVKQFPSMDFEGQKLAEKLYQCIIVLFAVVGFIWGYICQQFGQTVYILGAGVLLACLLVLPPWPLFRRNPLKWQKVKQDHHQQQQPTKQQQTKQPKATSSSTGQARKKEKKN